MLRRGGKGERTGIFICATRYLNEIDTAVFGYPLDIVEGILFLQNRLLIC